MKQDIEAEKGKKKEEEKRERDDALCFSVRKSSMSIAQTRLLETLRDFQSLISKTHAYLFLVPQHVCKSLFSLSVLREIAFRLKNAFLTLEY